MLRSQHSCGPQRKRFHRGKNLTRLYYYYHCYLSILAILSIETIDSLGILSCRQQLLRFNFTPHNLDILPFGCLQLKIKIKYFHSTTFLGLTDTVKSKIHIQERKVVNDHDTECYSKKNQNEIYKMIMLQPSLYMRVHKRIWYNYFRSIQLL